MKKRKTNCKREKTTPKKESAVRDSQQQCLQIARPSIATCMVLSTYQITKSVSQSSCSFDSNFVAPLSCSSDSKFPCPSNSIDGGTIKPRGLSSGSKPSTPLNSHKLIVIDEWRIDLQFSNTFTGSNFTNESRIDL